VFAPTLPSIDLYGCTVVLKAVAAWSGQGTALAKSFTDAPRAAGRPSTTLPTTFVLAGHSAGGEAVTYIADVLRTTYPAVFANLRYSQLLDPAKSPAGTTTLPPPHLARRNEPYRPWPSTGPTTP
jgi:hypothetical protein